MSEVSLDTIHAQGKATHALLNDFIDQQRKHNDRCDARHSQSEQWQANMDGRIRAIKGIAGGGGLLGLLGGLWGLLRGT